MTHRGFEPEDIERLEEASARLHYLADQIAATYLSTDKHPESVRALSRAIVNAIVYFENKAAETCET